MKKVKETCSENNSKWHGWRAICSSMVRQGGLSETMQKNERNYRQKQAWVPRVVGE